VQHDTVIAAQWLRRHPCATALPLSLEVRALARLEG
jgi:hypothetical protein